MAGGNKEIENDMVIRTLLERVHDLFPVHKIILFGSRALGTAHVDSDYDFLIIADTDLHPADRAAAVRLLLRDVPAAMDIIVATPEEFARLKTWISSVIHVAATDGKVLYEAA
jgi:uncharacterized protein